MDGSLVEEAGPQPLDSRVPVTVLTGFLGSGKTTLLNRILTENHGQRIAVIENEFGEIGIDQDLVISAEEEIFEMNNGCICCTVRGDLIRILGNLMRRRDRFDAVLIETTGMADPGPVVQTFFMDAEMARSMRLDAIVTIVDAGHLALHLGEQPEVEEQIAFADVVLLNKTDLVAPAVVDAIEAALRSINATAPIHRTVQAEIDLDRVLGVDGFSLDRALEIDPEFLEPEYPFEWAGVYEQPAGRLEFVVPPGPDNAMMAALLPLPRPTLEALDALLPEASALFSASRANGELLPPGSTLTIGQAARLDLSSGLASFHADVPAGSWALLTEHRPEEFGATLCNATGECTPRVELGFKAAHEHDASVSSVGLTSDQPLDLDRFNAWIRDLLMRQGPDIFRTKGVLNFDGFDQRFVFQGVHMLVEGRPDAPWNDAPRSSRMILIGRNLDRDVLGAGFAACLA